MIALYPSTRLLPCLLLTTLALGACGGGGSDDTATPLSAAPSEASPIETPKGGQACDSATGRVVNVGPGQTLATPSAAAAAAQNGDVIRIAAGDYRGDVAIWRQNDLTICGVGGRARLFADGKSAGGKAIWVVAGSNITIDNVEFRNAAVPDRNGAGIRAEHGGFLNIRNSGFFDNENGILTSAGAMSLVIEGSEFGGNGRGDGYTHNLYVGQIDRLTVSASFFHEAKVGHNLKSRARESIVENSYLMDGPAGTSSYLADFPNGGRVVMRGNLLHKGPNAQNPSAISFGAEGLAHATNTLELTHNTVAITRPGGAFVAVAAGTQSVKLQANLFAGTGNQAVLTGGFPAGNAVQSDNVIGLAGNIPGVDNVNNPGFWPDASLQAMLDLGKVVDAGYVRDAVRPGKLRAVGGAKKAGALQSAP